MKSKIFSIIYIISLSVFALTFSLSLPIYCRFFYYAHINLLNLVDVTGYSREQIIEAYNSVLNYLTLPFTEFSAGSLKFSLEGASHFKDVKSLFTLNTVALIVSFIIVVVLTILNKTNKITLYKFKNKSPFFYAFIINLAIPMLIGIVALIDFEFVFDVFHYIAFPGKSDWLFNPKLDEIINILPLEFFASCAILIGVSLIIISIIYLIIALKKPKNK